MNTSKTFWISGASSGIGRATAAAMAAAGHRVACVARDAARLDALVSGITRGGGKAIAIPCDVTDEAAVDRSLSACVEAFGGLDVLIPSAGVIASGSIEQMSMRDYDTMMTINVRSVVYCMKRAIPHLEKRPGCIVTISSTTGYRAFPGVFSYCLSKAAVEQATRCLALELAPRGIRVNGIAPGVIVTELHRRGGMDDAAYRQFLERAKQTHPLGHAGDTDDAVEAISYLCGDGAKWITGVILPVDGGRGITCLR
jgi:NAD(P)-dependent dehydrogenase (short-subunit alcohol dehydrogenase family)